MYGLIDCNNFFVSCERIFRPEIANKPVVVMSNNDGCAVAMSNEAKALGITRGTPLHQVRRIIRENNVVTLSGNHKLYGDISSRVMATIASIVPELEIYSIDEAFLNLSLIKDAAELESIGREIVHKVRRHVGIPTSLGIAPTKTLAKVASKFAKKYPGYRSVCLIDSEEKRRKALSMTELGDVWGIGRRLRNRFADYGITTAIQMADLKQSQIEGMLSITGQRTWRELNGQSCISLDLVEPDRKQICTSRSFSDELLTIEPLREAITSFCDNVARKLRKQHGCAKSLTVFIQTNSFHPERPQHFGNETIILEEATDDTITLTSAAIRVLYALFRKGYGYKRAGVIVSEIVSRNAVQQSLFANPETRRRRSRLMTALDRVNHTESTYNKLHLATFTPDTCRVRRDQLSPYYTTRLSDIITVKTTPGRLGNNTSPSAAI